MSNKILMLLSIVGRNKGKKLIKTLDNNNIRLHLQTTGFGTAPSEMMDILGLSGNDKDIIISYGTESSVKTLMRSFSDSFASYSEYGGLLMILKLSSINRLTSEIVTRTKTAGEIGDDEIMNNNHKHN